MYVHSDKPGRTLTLSRASSIKALTSEETMGIISLRRFSYRASRRLVAVRSSAVLERRSATFRNWPNIRRLLPLPPTFAVTIITRCAGVKTSATCRTRTVAFGLAFAARFTGMAGARPFRFVPCCVGRPRNGHRPSGSRGCIVVAVVGSTRGRCVCWR